MAKGSSGVTISRNLKTINDEIKACNSSFKIAAKSAKELQNALKLDPNNVKLSAGYMESLQKQVEVATKKIELLREAQRKMVEANGETAKATDQYKALDLEIEKTTAQVKALTKEIENSGKATEELSTKGSASMSSFQTVLGGVGKAFRNILGTATALVGAVVALGVSYASTADQIAKASTKYGMTAEEYQKQVNRWERLTGDANAYASVLSSLSSISASAEMENTKLGKVLEKLGLTFEDLKGLNPTEALEIYMEALRECESESERTNLAVKLFGTSIGPWMASMATAGAEQIAEWDQWLEEAGYLTNEQVKKGEELNDTFEQLRQTMRAVIADSGEDLVDLLNSLCNIAKNLMPLIKGITSAMNAIGPAGTIVLGTIVALSSAIPPLVVMLAALNAGAKQYVAAFTSLAILGTVASIGLIALSAGSSKQNGGLTSSNINYGSYIDEADTVAGANETSISNTTVNNGGSTTYYEDNSSNTYVINNELDVDEVIEEISNARRGVIGG